MKKNLLLILLICFFVACKKNVKNDNPILPYTDYLSLQEAEQLDALGIDTISTFEDAIFSNGTNMNQWLRENSLTSSKKVKSLELNGVNPVYNPEDFSDKKRFFIAAMTAAGINLTQHTTKYPGQIKLAYVYNGKNPTSVAIDKGSKCQEPLHGLDCSGMIYQMVIASLIPKFPAGGTEAYDDVKTWNNAFNSSNDFQSLTMTQVAIHSASLLEDGDIIIYPNKHMGMVFQTSSFLEALNSAGSPSYSCEENKNSQHGPVVTKSADKFLKIFEGNYHVLRIVQIGKPGLTIQPVDNITAKSASCTGEVTNTGNSTVTARGVCWNVSGTPTIVDQKTSNGIGLGKFNSNISGLMANTIYHLRAYATNSTGTTYSNEQTFQTTSSVGGGAGYYVSYIVNGHQVNFAPAQIRASATYLSIDDYLTKIIDNVSDIETQSDFSNIQIYIETSQGPSLTSYKLPNITGTNYIAYFNWGYAEIPTPHIIHFFGTTWVERANQQAVVTLTEITDKTVKGTFSATLYSKNGDKAIFTNGKFYLSYLFL